MRRAHRRWPAGRALGSLAGLLLGGAGCEEARAEPTATPPSAATATSPAEPEPPAHRLNWHYPRFRWWEYASSATVTLAGYYLQYGISGDFPDNHWHNGILFDQAARSAFRGGTPEAQVKAAQISDVIWPLVQYYPVFVDGLFVPLVTDRFNTDVALQLTLLNWQAQGFSFLLLRVAHRLVGRGRPYLEHCPNGPHTDPSCSPPGVGNTASFYSGHSSMTATAAGLTCAHHGALPLYGDPRLDRGICGVMIVSSLLTGALRVVADRHWATDVVTGWVLGGAVGYGLPTLLHYRPPFAERVLPKQSVIFPHATDDGGGLSWLGVF